MSGTFVAGEVKDRPGVYHRIENAGGLAVAGARNGVGAGLIRANWGPLGQVVECDLATDVRRVFGAGQTQDLITEMFTGGITAGKFVRVGTGGTAPAITLKDADDAEALTITGAYVGGRAFNATVRDSITGEGRECVIYEGTAEFLKVPFPAGEGEAAALAAALNAATRDFVAKLVEGYAGTGALADTAQAPFTAGTDPTVSAAEYAAGLTALEGTAYNVLCVDTEDAAVHTLVHAYLERTYTAGAYPMACVAEAVSVELAQRMVHAAAYNSPMMHVVLGSAVDAAGKVYDGYRLAARIGGMIAAVPTTQSLTHAVVSGFVGLGETLTPTEIGKALKKGCLVLTTNTAGQVQIEQGINTLVSPGADQDAGWKKIRRAKTRFELMQRTDDTLDAMVGKVDCDDNGLAAVTAAGQKVINAMVGEGKLVSGTFALDETNPAQGDSAWYVIEAVDKDSQEFIYLVYRFRFAAET